MNAKCFRVGACLAVMLVMPRLVKAATIDFNDLPAGLPPDILSFPGVRIYTEMSILSPSDTSGIWQIVHDPLSHEARDFLWDGSDFGTVRTATHGQITEWAGSMGVVVSASQLNDVLVDADFRESVDLGSADFFGRIGVEFTTGVSEFTVDVFSLIYSSQLVYAGVDAENNAFRGAVLFGGEFEDVFTRLHVAAPVGGQLTSFYYSMADTIEFPMRLNMDNLTYEPIGGLATHGVPEAGASAALLCLGMAALGAFAGMARRRTESMEA